MAGKDLTLNFHVVLLVLLLTTRTQPTVRSPFRYHEPRYIHTSSSHQHFKKCGCRVEGDLFSYPAVLAFLPRSFFGDMKDAASRLPLLESASLRQLSLSVRHNFYVFILVHRLTEELSPQKFQVVLCWNREATFCVWESLLGRKRKISNSFTFLF
jgi:hypothetical protein